MPQHVPSTRLDQHQCYSFRWNEFIVDIAVLNVIIFNEFRAGLEAFTLPIKRKNASAIPYKSTGLYW